MYKTYIFFRKAKKKGLEEPDKYPWEMENDGLGLETTELRLGLPGGGGDAGVNALDEKNEKKRGFYEFAGEDENSSTDDRKTQKKNPVVGWPPVCSHRRKNGLSEKDDQSETSSKMYVKVSMDSAPFLRKLDLAIHTGYSDLASGLDKLFCCFKTGKGLRDGEVSDYVPIYEDKEGDWMLVGDMPWEMFMESCKRLRIMKRSEAKGFGLSTKEFLKTTHLED